MESQKPKIAMYVKRPFGEKLNASFDFIKENWKQLFKYSTYLILPICLIQAANFSGLMGSMTDITAMQASGGISDNPLAALGPSFALNYAGVIFFSCLGALLMTSLIYAMVRLYNEREERLNGVVFGDIKSLLLRNVKRLFLMGIACSFLFIFAVIFIVLLAVLTPFTLILTIPLLFAFMVPLALMAPIYLFEDISLGEAFAKTFRLGFATWGGVFLILIVMGIIASVLQGIVSIPWYVIYIVKMIFTMSDGGATSSSVGLNFAQYLFSILMLYGSYLSAIFGIVGLVYQYGHASEVVDSITVESDYNCELITPEMNVFEWISRQFGELLRKIFGSHFAEEYSGLILVCIAILLLLLIVWFVYRKRPELFMVSHKNALPYTVEEDTIYGVDFPGGIAEALSRQNYREAVRLLYLQTLKQLSDAERIDWQLYKTPTQYINEVRLPAFRQLTNHFLRVRYGNFEATEELFRIMQTLQEEIGKGGVS